MNPWSGAVIFGLAGFELILDRIHPGEGDAGLDLEACATTEWQRANGSDSTAGDEERLPASPARSSARSGTPRASAAARAGAGGRRRSEGLDPVSQSGCFLVAQALGQIREPRSEPVERPALVELLELLRRA